MPVASSSIFNSWGTVADVTSSDSFTVCGFAKNIMRLPKCFCRRRFSLPICNLECQHLLALESLNTLTSSQKFLQIIVLHLRYVLLPRLHRQVFETHGHMLYCVVHLLERSENQACWLMFSGGCNSCSKIHVRTALWRYHQADPVLAALAIKFFCLF